MAIGFCGIRNSFLVSFFSTNLVSKEGSKDSNVPENTNNDDETVEDDEAELGYTGQSKKSCSCIGKIYKTKQDLVFSVKLQFGKTLVSVQNKFALQKDFLFTKFWTKNRYKFQEKILLQKILDPKN